jgi:hypothetical protein
MNEVLTSAVIAAFVSGLFAIYLRTEDRRKIRAEVLETIYGIEVLRWSDSKHEDFMRGIRKLRAKSLVARSNREKVEWYIYLASIARDLSEQDREDGLPSEEYLGAIPKELNDLTRSAAELVIAELWSPIRSKLFNPNSLEEIKEDTKKYKRRVTSMNKRYPEERPTIINWDLKI